MSLREINNTCLCTRLVVFALFSVRLSIDDGKLVKTPLQKRRPLDGPEPVGPNDHTFYDNVSAFLAKRWYSERKLVCRVSSYLIEKRLKLGQLYFIGWGNLKAFRYKAEDTGETRYLRYQYGCSKKADYREFQEFDPIEEKRTVDLAKWFASEDVSSPFAAYHFHNWNSEHFAVFCKTARVTCANLTEAQLSIRHHSSRRQKALVWRFLKESSDAEKVRYGHDAISRQEVCHPELDFATSPDSGLKAPTTEQPAGHGQAVEGTNADSVCDHPRSGESPDVQRRHKASPAAGDRVDMRELAASARQEQSTVEAGKQNVPSFSPKNNLTSKAGAFRWKPFKVAYLLSKTVAAVLANNQGRCQSDHIK